MDKSKEINRSFRISEDLWNAFTAACRNNDTSASRELRESVRRYVAKHGQGNLKL